MGLWQSHSVKLTLKLKIVLDWTQISQTSNTPNFEKSNFANPQPNNFYGFGVPDDMKVFFFIRPYFLVSFTWLVNGQCYVVTNILLLYEHKYVVATIFNLSSYKSCHFQIIREIGFTRHYTNRDLSKISIPFLSYRKTVGICHIRSKILTYCTLHFTQCVEMLKKLQIQEKFWKIIILSCIDTESK